MAEIPGIAADELAWISTEQMVEVDRVMIEDLHIELIQMMENAGRNLAQLTMALFAPASVTVFAGSGGNGGGGLVAARHLANRGVRVQVALTRDELDGVPGHQLEIVRRMGLEVVAGHTDAEVAIDAVIGYSLSGAPSGRAAQLIELINGHASVVSLDTPSGLDTATGRRPGVSVAADATLTLAMPKAGLRDQQSTGRLFVGDISVPAGVYGAFGAAVRQDLFAESPILEVH